MYSALVSFHFHPSHIDSIFVLSFLYSFLPFGFSFENESITKIKITEQLDDFRFVHRHGVFHAQRVWEAQSVAVGICGTLTGVPLGKAADRRGATTSPAVDCLPVVL